MTTTPRPLPATLTPHLDNILRTYRDATAGQTAAGLAWYADAHTFALSLSDDIDRAAGVIAALSPRVNWARNMVLASRAFVEGRATGTLPHSCETATTILHGAPWREVLSGPKTRAFAATIADPTDPHHVVIDRHALSIAIGRVSTDADSRVLARKGGYETFAECYRDAARTVGISPAQMQAITWVVWRETKIKNASAVRRGVFG